MNSFSELLERQIPVLRRYAYALHRLNRSRADDLVQDTLVRAISKQHLWTPGSNLRSWLFTLMHHQNVNDVRRSTVRRDLCFDVEELHDNLAAVNDTSASLQLRWPHSPAKSLPFRPPVTRGTGVSATVPTGLQGARLHQRRPTSTEARPIRAI